MFTIFVSAAFTVTPILYHLIFQKPWDRSELHARRSHLTLKEGSIKIFQLFQFCF